MTGRILVRALALSLALIAAAEAEAQHSTLGPCAPDWEANFDRPTPLNADVIRVFVHDDGSGAALFVGGQFTHAGAISLGGIGKWQGGHWTALGAAQSNAHVWDMVAFDDGTGTQLYACGVFSAIGGVAANNIARWNGSTWAPLGAGTNGHVRAVAVFDDGSGPALYAAGAFTSAGGLAATRAAKWDGATWSSIGANFDNAVFDLTVYDDGVAPRLYAGGVFSSAGSPATAMIAAWDGTSWNSLNGLGSTGVGVVELHVFDEGSGPALYAGGRFSSLCGVAALNVARWDGSSWSALGAGVPDEVLAMAQFDSGGGPRVFVGQTAPGGASGAVHAWNGVNWAVETPGFGGRGPYDMTVFDDGSGPRMYAGGAFLTIAGVQARRLASYSPAGWLAVDEGRSQPVHALAITSLGGAPRLVVGSTADVIDSVVMQGIGAWDGANWSALGGGLNAAVRAIVDYDDGGGPALYATGDFNTAGGSHAAGLARWDGSAWSTVGSGLSGSGLALAVYDSGSGPELYVGGSFTNAGGSGAGRIARWNGTLWQGLGAAPNLAVRALCVHDDGTGPALFVGGDFTLIGGAPMSRIAKWNGVTWSTLGSGTIGAVRALEVFDDGAGPALFVGGSFSQAGGLAADRIARWRAGAWSTLGSGVNANVLALRAFDDGSGPALFVGGAFTTAGGVPGARIAKWDGSSWSPLGAGITSAGAQVNALEVFDDGAGPALFIGGSFATSPAGDGQLAVWRGCSTQPTTFCTPQAPGTSSGCIATMVASGQPDAAHSSPCVLVVSNVEGAKTGLLFYGVSGQVNSTWCASSANRLCVAPPSQRMGVQGSGGTAGACDGTLVEDWNAFQLSHTGALGNPWLSGATVDVQAWFRDPPACKTTSLSGGVRLTYQ